MTAMPVPVTAPWDDALRAVLMAGALPLWAMAGFGDWLCHRLQRMEETAGLPEAILHSLMLAVLGTASLAVLFLQVNAAVLLGMLLACVVHEGLVWRDLAFANRHRKVGAIEQWIHGIQTAMPWVLLVGICLLHRDQFLAILGAAEAPADWVLRPKRDPLPGAYLVTVLIGCGVLVVLPFLEELWRCARTQRRHHHLRGDPR